MAWPFERANALGYAMFELFTSADATLIDKNAAAAADGSIWSDIAHVVNFFPQETLPGSDVNGQVVMWEPTKRRWWNFGKDGSGNKSSGYYSSLSGPWVFSNLEIPAATNWTESHSACHDGNGLMLLGGEANNQQKIRRSADAGTTWTIETTGTSSSGGVAALAWAPSCNLFIAALNTGQVETSPDGIAWTTRTTPDSKSRSGIAVSPTRIVVVHADISDADKILTSEDGITWTQRTLAYASQGSITWNAQRGLFMIIAADRVQTSPDGITWTLVTSSAPGIGSDTVVSLGRMFLRGGDTLYISTDDGATWEDYTSFDMSGVAATAIASSGSQIVAYRNGTFQRSLFCGL